MKWSVFLTFIFFSNLSCHHTESDHTHQAVEVLPIKIDQNAEKIIIPNSLWDDVGQEAQSSGSESQAAPSGHESAPKAEGHAEKAPQEHGEKNQEKSNQDKTKIASFFLDDLEIELIEKNAGVLKQSEFSFRFERGGGVLDLHDYLSEQSGSFYVQFKIQKQEDEEIRVHFYPSLKAREIDGETWGQDCNKVYDISSYLEKNKKILTNTSSFRHGFLLSGFFIMTRKKKNNVMISALEIKDSRLKAEPCRYQKE